MLDVLFELAKLKEYASFYSNFESDKFKFGYILAVNEKEIALQLLSPDGVDDGIVAMDSNRIFRVETKGMYAEKMKKLRVEAANSEWLTPIDENSIFLSILQNPLLKDKIVSIELNDSGYYATTGFLQTAKDGQCVVKQVNDYGFEDGFSYLLTSNITEIEISSDLEKRIQRLWEINYGNIINRRTVP